MQEDEDFYQGMGYLLSQHIQKHIQADDLNEAVSCLLYFIPTEKLYGLRRFILKESKIEGYGIKKYLSEADPSDTRHLLFQDQMLKRIADVLTSDY